MLEVKFAFCAALVAVVYADILPDDPTPASGWFNLLSKWAEKPVKWWEYPRQWVAYPLGYCSKCCAGHLALWAFFIAQGFTKDSVSPAIVTACLAIIGALLISKLVRWSKQ